MGGEIHVGSGEELKEVLNKEVEGMEEEDEGCIWWGFIRNFVRKMKKREKLGEKAIPYCLHTDHIRNLQLLAFSTMNMTCSIYYSTIRLHLFFLCTTSNYKK